MLVPLNEPSNFRYIYINSASNRVHLLIPFIAGLDVSTDNTCKSDLELKAFFEGGAVKELESYKNTLEFHLSLLEESDKHYYTKKERLAQIDTYLEAVVDLRGIYRSVVNTLLSKPSNLYSIQLRPRVQDPMSRVVNPVFTINRGNDRRGAPLSPLYNEMHKVFAGLSLGKVDPRTELIKKVLDALPSNTSFENMQAELAIQYGVPDDFFKKITDAHRQEQMVDKSYVDTLMGFDAHTTSREYIEALLGICAPNFQSILESSPFYFECSSVPSEKAERLSILTQFYLGSLNVYCRAKGISNKNFGVILDKSSRLSKALVELVANTLSRGGDVEHAVIDFCNAHQGKNEFDLSRGLSTVEPENDKDAIVQKFKTTYRTVTATKENPHMDDFMLLDTEALGDNDIFFTNKGLICTDASNIIPRTSQNQDYLAEIHTEARMHRDIVTPQDEPVITIDIEPAALMDKLSHVQWDRLPQEVVDVCHAQPAFKVRDLLDDVAKGKQDEARLILESSQDKQTLLKTPGKFTDYSGRTFHCTAYEYAYWAKDTHMQRMLERHMDDETKALMLEKIDAMEHSGLLYQQHGISYQNAHYDMSFVLKHLNADEFRQLKTMVGRRHSKIQQATTNNYKTISFTATEYESLKKILLQRCPKGIFSIFYSSPAIIFCEKLQFDFRSLITALDNYLTNYDNWDFHRQVDAWMKVGKAQRDVPAHIAHEYCRQGRLFDPLPSFNEPILPRDLTIHNYITNDKAWFPLSSSSSGLGFDFALIRAGAERAMSWSSLVNLQNEWPNIDLAAVRHLDETRIGDLTLSRETLSRPANRTRMAY
ncbi:hypothetical protein [Legionella yabuuchiae]|uniref:hypothetical protein n=1 Tax=Legionella yabuuchiae TaxID=376727 RepID=UPI0010557A99|nr:hypothetical protein [Legionella yabuuchiae]